MPPRKLTVGKQRVEKKERPKVKARNTFKVEAKSKNQEKYIESIKNNTITICSGFAGTGKTLIAIGMAVSLVQNSNIFERVVVVRPAIEACGEKIGFLPGGISDKMRPLIEPVIDNLRVFFKDEGHISSMLEPSSSYGAPLIEVIPMAFLRGRTFNNCVVVFDEAQNATPAQFKLFLTRIGANCKVIIEGDVTQSDIHRDKARNGLFDAFTRLHDIPDVGLVMLEVIDVQRNPILIPVLKRYGDVDGI